MSDDLKDALDAWNQSACREEWRRVTESPIYQQATYLIKLLMQGKIEGLNIATNAAVSDRVLFGHQAGLHALHALKSLGNDPPKAREALPKPYSCYADPQTPTPQ
jgi:hypothetical protein